LQKFQPFRSGQIIAKDRKIDNNSEINQLNFYKGLTLTCFSLVANIWRQTGFPRLICDKLLFRFTKSVKFTGLGQLICNATPFTTREYIKAGISSA